MKYIVFVEAQGNGEEPHDDLRRVGEIESKPREQTTTLRKRAVKEIEALQRLAMTDSGAKPILVAADEFEGESIKARVDLVFT